MKTSYVQSKFNASQVVRSLAENLHENDQLPFSLGVMIDSWIDTHTKGALHFTSYTISWKYMYEITLTCLVSVFYSAKNQTV